MRIIKRMDMAVDFVLERVGIAVEPSGDLWRDQIDAGMIVINASGQRLGHVDEFETPHRKFIVDRC